MLQSEYIFKKWDVKDKEMWNILYIKRNAEKNVTLALSYQGAKTASYFQFEQLSRIPVVSLLLTFDKYTASVVLLFSIHDFYVSKCNLSEWRQVCIRKFEKKQTKNERRKENHRRKTNYFRKACNVLGKILYCILNRHFSKHFFTTGKR